MMNVREEATVRSGGILRVHLLNCLLVESSEGMRVVVESGRHLSKLYEVGSLSIVDTPV